MIGQLFKGRQRAPYSGRAASIRPSETGEETEAQRNAREQQDRQFKAAQEQRLAMDIANTVLKAGQFGLGVYQASKDPAAIRTQQAQAAMLGEFETGAREGVSQDPLAPLAPVATDPSAAAASGTPAGPTGVPEGMQPISMSQGDLEQLLANMPAAQANYGMLPDGSAPPKRKALIQQLVTLPNVRDAAHADELISSALGQGAMIAERHEGLFSSGAFKRVPGDATGFWDLLGGEATKPGWKPQHRAAQALRPGGGGRVGGDPAPTADYLGKLAEARGKYGDAVFPKVVERVMADPAAGDAIIAEISADPAAAGAEWAAIAEAAKKGDRGPAIDAVIKYLTMTPEELRGVSKPQGLGRAEAFFGPGGEVRIPLDTSIVDLQGAIASLRESEQHGLANKLLREEAWGRTTDFASVPGAAKSARPKDAIVQFLNAGKAELDMDPRKRAMQFYELAKGEGALRAKETTAKAALARATRSVSRSEHVGHKGRTTGLGEDDWKTSWRDRPEYQRILEMVGEGEAEKVLHRQWRNQKQNYLYKRYVELGKVEKEEGASAKAATEAEAAAGKQSTKDRRTLLRDKRSFEKDVRDRKTDLKEALSRWGVSPGGKVSVEGWVKKKLIAENVSTAGRKARRKELLREARAGVLAANTEIANALQAVTDAEASKAAFLETFEK